MLFTADETPACSWPPAASTADVSGTVAIAVPSPKDATAGSTSLM